MQDEYFVAQLKSVSEYLPPALRAAVSGLSYETKARVTELRLRAGRNFSVILTDREVPVLGRDQKPIPVTAPDILYVLDRATQSSIHSYQNSLKNGFVTVAGGHRIGICGSAIIKDGDVSSFRDFSSLSIRVAKEIKGIANDLVSAVSDAGGFHGTLIVSPPGGGKTTLLRDMIRVLSETYRVGVADERSELAGVFRGNAQFDLGTKTDVIDACPKSVSVMMLLRGMNPEIIAVDEITVKEDADALRSALHCGVSLLATAHAESLRDIREKPMYRALIDCGAFQNLVLIRKQNGEHNYELIRLKEAEHA